MPKSEETRNPLKRQPKPPKTSKIVVKIPESFKGVNISQEIKKQKALKLGAIKEQKALKPGTIKVQKPLKSGTIKKVKKPKHTKIKVGELPTSLKRADSNLFLIKKDILPPTLLKVIKVNEALKCGDALTIKDALEKFDLDHSLYYKYKNSIFPFYEATKDEIFTFLFSVEHREGVLASIINLISNHLGNILTINQGFPINGVAIINISVDLTLLNINVENLINRLKNLKNVREMEILGRVKS